MQAVKDYSCDVYLKGLGRITKNAAIHSRFPNEINRAAATKQPPDKDGVVYLGESQSRLYYEQPDKFHEIIYSSKVSGKMQGYTYNSAQDFYFNFYDRNISIGEGIADRPFISPLSEEAFFFYKFHMLGAYKEGDQWVNKIEVIPKRANDPCFSGVLSIIEDNWNIHSLELYLYSRNGMRYIDTLKITQYFIPVKSTIYGCPRNSATMPPVSAASLGVRAEEILHSAFSAITN